MGVFLCVVVYFPLLVPSLCFNMCVHSLAQDNTDAHQLLDKPEHLLDVMKSYSVKTGQISVLIMKIEMFMSHEEYSFTILIESQFNFKSTTL